MTTRALAVLALATALGTAESSAAARAPIAIEGSIELRPVAFAGCLMVDVSDAKVVECSASGRLRGRTGPGRAAYTWHWHLFRGGDVPQTARGDEDGILVLVFRIGSLRLTTSGTKSPGSTSGTWRYSSGTRAFEKRRGSGTYRFVTTTDGGGFRTARLALRGTIR